MKYVGEIKRELKFRLADPRGYINNQDETQATGKHLNSPGHSLVDLSITVLEKVISIEKKGESISLESLTHYTEA